MGGGGCFQLLEVTFSLPQLTVQAVTPPASPPPLLPFGGLKTLSVSVTCYLPCFWGMFREHAASACVLARVRDICPDVFLRCVSPSWSGFITFLHVFLGCIYALTVVCLLSGTYPLLSWLSFMVVLCYLCVSL